MDIGSASATLDGLEDDIGNIVIITRDEQDTRYDEEGQLTDWS